ncbi:hypothetical protein KOR34_10880 [Posidoniimonas corsicana]|uniref:Helix-turn-helix domain protein n=1 Tax=Posidoniimonas corsicana TaxID=1938618 RepID=A0A5C5VE06_9BACT|nr:excisionase family DNA-binding protein [Posidoniimonas corsicana]TWT36187.1 hypothetical protein KOR34_10880 [Posidoniimonas corsicana]
MKKSPSESFQQLTGAVSLGAVARRTGLPRRQVRRLVQQGQLPFVQVRGQICVPAKAVRELSSTPRYS